MVVRGQRAFGEKPGGETTTPVASSLAGCFQTPPVNPLVSELLRNIDRKPIGNSNIIQNMRLMSNPSPRYDCIDVVRKAEKKLVQYTVYIASNIKESVPEY
jgi:hypothetical protein